MEALKIARFDVFAWRVAVAEPVQNSFGNQSARATVSLRVEDSDGAHGWGDIWANFPAPAPEYRAALAAEVVLPSLVGRFVEDINAFFAEMEATTRLLALQSAEPGPFASVVGGVDMALWDLVGRKQGRPVRHLLNPRSAADTVPCYASGINPGNAGETVARCQQEGFHAFKVKVGFGRDADVSALTAARDEMAEGQALMTDANQKWTLEEAGVMAAVLRDLELDWLEEPMAVAAPAADWQRLRAAMVMPLAGGENLRGEETFAAARWLDVVQPDIGKWGGVTKAHAIGCSAVAGGKTYCPHWLAGGIGLVASANVLAAVGGPGRLEIDANPNPLRTALVPHNASAVAEGLYWLPDGPGLGIEPDLAALSDSLLLHREVAR
jgi:D-galactarolactone cycloisomerase